MSEGKITKIELDDGTNNRVVFTIHYDNGQKKKLSSVRTMIKYEKGRKKRIYIVK